MATLKQIANILNSIELPQLQNVDPESGEISYTLIADDLSNIADFGKAWEDLSAEDFEDYSKKFIGGVTQLALDTRGFNKSLGLEIPYGEFGAIIYKGKSGLAKVTDDERFNLQNGVSYNQDTFVGFDINKRVYVDSHDFDIDYSIPASMWSDVFKAPEGAIKITAYIENRVDMTVNASIYAVEKGALRSVIKNGYSGRIKLVKLFNDTFNTSLTTETCMNNYDFKEWVCEIIKNLAENLDDLGELYNDGTIVTHTPREDVRIKLLTPFATSLEMGLKSGVFNDDLLDFGDYKTVNFWQTRTGKIPTIANCGSVTWEDDEEEIVVNNVVGVIMDKNACAVSTYGGKTRMHFNARGDFYNYFRSTLCKSMVDSRESAIVLTLEDE